MDPDVIRIRDNKGNIVEAERPLYDMTIVKFANYHSIMTSLPLLLVIPFVALLIQSFTFVTTVPAAPFLAIFVFIVFFGTLYAFISNKLYDTEQFIERGCKECLVRKTLQEEILDFLKTLAKS